MNPMLAGFAIKAAIIVALIAGAYVKGCSDEKERFDDFKLMTKAVGEAQNAWTKAQVAKSTLNKKDYDDAHKAKITELERDNIALLDRMQRDTASRRIVPPVPGAAQGGDGFLCLKADELNARVGAALATLLAGTLGVFQRGDVGLASFETCASWALKEHKKTPMP